MLCVQVYVKVGIYHGREPLCAVVRTSKGAASEGTEWNENLDFDIPIRDVPRGAKLCLVVFAAPERYMYGQCKCGPIALAMRAWLSHMCLPPSHVNLLSLQDKEQAQERRELLCDSACAYPVALFV